MNMAINCERDDALRDAQMMARDYGMPITIRIRKESNVQRDIYGSVKSRESEYIEKVFYSLPFISNPNHRELEKAGLRENAQALAYTCTQDWVDAGILDQKGIDAERTTVIVGADEMRIVEKNNDSQFADTFLYVTLALRRL